nr:hypothetical protein [Microbacterium telephonicum]
MTRPRSLFALGVVLAATAALAGCTGAAPVEPSTAPPIPTASPSPTPTGPVLLPDGSAEDNLPLFTEIMNQVWATDARVQGRAYVDALVAAGFPKADMEVTNDQTSVGNPADAVQFSVAWAGECLVGQVGPSTPAPTAVVMPALPEGDCLIGVTRTIDW